MAFLMNTTNEHGQPVGPPLGEWSPPPFPPQVELQGRHVTLEPLDPNTHTSPLFSVFADAPDDLWTYMSIGPFGDETGLRRSLEGMVALDDWLPYAISVRGQPLGFASYLRIQPRDGVIEIGSIVFSPALQRTTAATEAIYLMVENCFALGYRRCEWKCDDLNQPSREAAHRLGFIYEGTFRRATHYKGRSRDTAWYAITDLEWPDLRTTFHQWLSPSNFDDSGNQRRSLRQIREGS